MKGVKDDRANDGKGRLVRDQKTVQERLVDVNVPTLSVLVDPVLSG